MKFTVMNLLPQKKYAVYPSRLIHGAFDQTE